MIDKKKIEEAADIYIDKCIKEYEEERSGEACKTMEQFPCFGDRGEAFEAGVNWFKENLWHDDSEEPKLDKSILLELASNDYVVVKLRSKYDFSEYPYNKAYRWLYIEDLTKGGK